jgi:glycosyltransferase involved in cell wall biosynthesis
VPALASQRRYGLLGFPFSRLPSREASYSSLDTVTWSTARALRRGGADVVVGAWEVQPGDAEGVEVLPVDGRPDWALRAAVRAPTRRRDVPRWTSRLHHPFHLLSGVQALRRHGADVIQLTHEFANLLPAKALAGKAALITQLHAVWVDDHPGLVRRLLRADGVATVSDFVRRELVRLEPRLEGRTGTVRNGVDLEAFPGRDAVRAKEPEAIAAWRRRLDATDRPLVVAVGRVTPEKGTHVLAEAAALLQVRGCDVVIAVAGQKQARYQRPGRARHPLWQRIEQLNEGYLGRVTTTAEELPFHLLDTVAPPSLSPEPCPLPALEAMAMDLPVVASCEGGYPELVGDAAILVQPDDAGALADAIEHLVAHPGERERLARLARPQAARHTWDATAAALAHLADRIH